MATELKLRGWNERMWTPSIFALAFNVCLSSRKPNTEKKLDISPFIILYNVILPILTTHHRWGAPCFVVSYLNQITEYYIFCIYHELNYTDCCRKSGKTVLQKTEIQAPNTIKRTRKEILIIMILLIKWNIYKKFMTVFKGQSLKTNVVCFLSSFLTQ